MNFYEELLKVSDFASLFDRLAAFAAAKMEGIGTKELNGLQPEDIVSNLLEKIVNDTRDATKANCTLEEFLFGCVQSEVYALLKRKKPILREVEEQDETNTQSLSRAETEKTKALYLNELRQQGADEKEIQLFCAWAEGFTKPKAAAAELEWTVPDVNNVSKRLLRKMDKIKHLTQYLV
jgi:DNA-directed RNA polymerase specialized sigma24 family protein